MSSDDFSNALTDPQQAGVFFLVNDDFAGIELIASQSPLRTLHIALAHCTDKTTLLQRIAAALETPQPQGHNWDALADQLRDLSWLSPQAGYVLIFSQAAEFKEADPASFELLLDILDEAAIYWQLQNTPFWAFLLLPDAA
jgi:hypothetical protein